MNENEYVPAIPVAPKFVVTNHVCSQAMRRVKVFGDLDAKDLRKAIIRDCHSAFIDGRRKSTHPRWLITNDLDSRRHRQKTGTIRWLYDEARTRAYVCRVTDEAWFVMTVMTEPEGGTADRRLKPSAHRRGIQHSKRQQARIARRGGKDRR